MIVYWCESTPDGMAPQCQIIDEGQKQIKELIELTTELRQQGKHFVTSTSEGAGADIVRDGKLPNGQPYTWKKRR